MSQINNHGRVYIGDEYNSKDQIVDYIVPLYQTKHCRPKSNKLARAAGVPYTEVSVHF